MRSSIRYQMLGRLIADPLQVESAVPEASGLAMLDVDTIFGKEKITTLVRAVDSSSGLELSGYEIHCGRISRNGGSAAFTVVERDGREVHEPEGTVTDDGRVLGTSIHGLFDEPGFRRHYLARVGRRKGLDLSPAFLTENAKTFRLRSYDRLADLLAAHLDIPAVAALVGLNLDK